MRIRIANESDAASILQLHFDSVHITAAPDYEPEILDDWSKPVEGRLEAMQHQLRINPEQTEMFVCEIEGRIVGFGELAPRTKEVRAVYVSPTAARKGIGKALLNKILEAARTHQLSDLWLDSSLTAVPFYSSQGFVGDIESEHILRSGRRMRCVKMHKQV